ncbi:MAG TPA: hypothetical protein VH280_22415 [Verrucomicrobiae bacterium]|jgi:hypothetical protein|nr:hypothetical protein [Verrucomicrobiae bacterium]
MPLPEPSLSAPRFAFLSESEEPKIPANKAASVVEWIAAQQPGLPRPIANAALAKIWLLQVDEFRKSEQLMMASGEHDKDLTTHCFFLLKLISNGKLLLDNAKTMGIAETTPEFTLNDLQATFDSLQTTYFCEYGPKNSDRQNKIIEGLFNGQKS